ncbi:Uncharacterized protein Adt_04220 [Abeliophyllum distichum]|uniref:Uncharacterized protein n=1 Tax=Abeliophyllum distichum TaxID=126358 RepID=A0ABD1W111_9LAMI
MVRFSTAWKHHYLDRSDPEIHTEIFSSSQSEQAEGRPQEREGGLEETVAKLSEQMEIGFKEVQKRHDVAIKNIENQIGRLVKLLTERQPDTWPSTIEVNPKEQVNAITTRSGAELPKIYV